LNQYNFNNDYKIDYGHFVWKKEFEEGEGNSEWLSYQNDLSIFFPHRVTDSVIEIQLLVNSNANQIENASLNQ
jgi:hypothetical protein